MAIGIRDIAAHAGVSTATVMRVLRGNGPVSSKARAAVEKALEELHYVPNAAARALTRGRSNLLGLFVPDISNPFYSEVAKGLEDVAVAHDFHCVVASSDLDLARERDLMRIVYDGTLAGFAIAPMGSATTLGLDGTRPLPPCVFIDRRVGPSTEPLVETSNREAAAEAVTFLIEQGHRRIAMISGPREFPTASQRLAGYRQALEDAGLQYDERLLHEGYLGESGGRAAMDAVLALDPRPTAVFSFNNLLTVGALHSVRSHGVQIPDDLSLVTFDDMPLFPFVDPPVTALVQPTYEIGRRAGQLLIQKLRGESQDVGDVTLPARLAVRSSTASPR